MKRFSERLLARHRPRRPRLLGVLLCYNDGDLVEDAVGYLAGEGHDVVVWDHGSTDATPEVLKRLRPEILELRTIPRSVDFYGLYQMMSQHLIDEYVAKYDWVSWPDQDEFLEGPDRARPYREWVEEVIASPYDWVQFNNYNFWWTPADDPNTERALDRVRHYSLFGDCGPRVRAWRASCTNIREFNHNPPLGERYPKLFNLRHYPMRSEAQMARRLQQDRAGLRRGGANYHYANMSSWPERLVIPPDMLHFDDGRAELDPGQIFDWRTVYGREDSTGHPPA
ncbi:MAG TPA: glycosyltransferase family 2 protein [Acidimicrobiales bacterium]|nr:glycosyltransferase family 2 protein [Acidimicrobiales bacterium]